MSTDVYSSPLSERYASKEMQYIFSQDMKFRTWRRLWIALAESEMELGLNITKEQVDELKAHKDEINYDVAKESGALVVPLATIQEGSKVYAIVDDTFNICEYGQQEGLTVLRDKMATAKYELMDKYAHGSRKDIGDARQYWDNFLVDLIATSNGLYDYEIENTAQYIDKRITEPADAFAHLATLQPSLNNAFLFRKD